MLKHRLIFGTLMTILFVAIILFDGWLDGSLTISSADDKPIQGTILCGLVSILVIPAVLEFSKIVKVKKAIIFVPLSIATTVLFATSWYWQQIFKISLGNYLIFISAFSLFGMFLYQYFRYGTKEVILNCGTNCFLIIYLGVLCAFVPAIRIKFGLWAFLMFVFVIKSSDIGAYTFGRLFGKHKFCPGISPGKTWEGMAGGVLAAIIVAVIFAVNFGIMIWQLAVIFGLCFAFIGQLGDLAESMIKRDAEQKDSSNSVPGFGGILDVIDSPLASACFAYLFFCFSIN